MEQGRSTKIISTIEWIRTTRLTIKHSLVQVPAARAGRLALGAGRARVPAAPVTPPPQTITLAHSHIQSRAHAHTLSPAHSLTLSPAHSHNLQTLECLPLPPPPPFTPISSSSVLIIYLAPKTRMSRPGRWACSNARQPRNPHTPNLR